MIKFAELKLLVAYIASLLHSNQQDDGLYQNTRWRMSGDSTGVDMDGILELADADKFDRWANSTTIHINLLKVEWESGYIEDVITKAFAIYG